MSLKTWWQNLGRPDVEKGASPASREFIVDSIMPRFPMTKRPHGAGHVFDRVALLELFGDPEYLIPEVRGIYEFAGWVRGRYIERVKGWFEAVFECENHADDGQAEAAHGELELGLDLNLSRGRIAYFRQEGGKHAAKWWLGWDKGKLVMLIEDEQSGRIRNAEHEVKEIVWFAGP